MTENLPAAALLWPVVQAFPVLPWIFRIPAANSVRAMIADTGRTGNVVPIVAEIVLRLCRGSLGSTGKLGIGMGSGLYFPAIYRIQLITDYQFQYVSRYVPIH